jgi:hypothetical protein
MLGLAQPLLPLDEDLVEDAGWGLGGLPGGGG